jgi:hypothetical protein
MKPNVGPMSCVKRFDDRIRAYAANEVYDMRSTGLALLGCAVFSATVAPLAKAAPPDDACSLLSQTQVGAALGVPVAAGTYVTPTFKKTCTWNATTSGGGYVTLMLQDLDAYQGGKQSGQMKSISETSISGIGDDAYFLAVGNNVGLIVKKGNIAFKVAVYAHIPIEKKQAMEKALAQQVVPKL